MFKRINLTNFMSNTPNNFIKKTITIGKIAQKDGRYSITDQDGEIYSFFADKKDGQLTAALKSFQELKVKKDKIIGISYKIAGKYKNILWFEVPSPDAKVPPFVGKKELAEKVDEREEKENEKWDLIGKKKTRCAIAEALITRGSKFSLETEKELNDWTRVILEEERATKEKAEIEYAENEVRNEQQMGVYDEDVKEEEIPF